MAIDMDTWRAGNVGKNHKRATWNGRLDAIYGLRDRAYLHVTLDREPDRAVVIFADRQQLAEWVTHRIVGDPQSQETPLLDGDSDTMKTHRLRILCRLGVPYEQAYTLAGFEGPVPQGWGVAETSVD